MEVLECKVCKYKFENEDAFYNVRGFCSEECLLDSAKPKVLEEFDETLLLKKGKICEICGTLHYYTLPYCCNQCRIEYNKKVKLSDPKIQKKKYCSKFNEEFKVRVRAFFGNKCFLCSKTEKENGKKLSIHHVNYDKDTLCNDGTVLFVPLCNNCHTLTNTNRDRWENFFSKELKEKYHNKCYLTKKELYSLGRTYIDLSDLDNETYNSKDEEINKLKEEIRVLRLHKEKLLKGFYQNPNRL